MISHTHRCIFIHQRKCAGTSIIDSFGLEPTSPDWRFANDGVLSQEWNAHPEWIRSYYKFAVIRNPWERFISGWKYCQSTRDRPLLDVLGNLPPEGHDFRHLTRPQCATLYDANGKLAADRLIRQENLEDEFREVCRKINKADVSLKKLNPGQRSFFGGRPDYRKLFQAKERLLFEKAFAEDIARLGYSF